MKCVFLGSNVKQQSQIFYISDLYFSMQMSLITLALHGVNLYFFFFYSYT